MAVGQKIDLNEAVEAKVGDKISLDEAVSVDDKPFQSPTGSAALSYLHGGTYGLSSRALAALKAMTGEGTYDEWLDRYNDVLKSARENNPNASTTGEIASFLSPAGIIKGISKGGKEAITKGGKELLESQLGAEFTQDLIESGVKNFEKIKGGVMGLLKRFSPKATIKALDKKARGSVIAGMDPKIFQKIYKVKPIRNVLGAATGAGIYASNEPEDINALEAAGTGAGVQMLANTAMPILGKATRGLGGILTGTPSGLIEDYLAKRGKVKTARPIDEVAEEFQKGVSDLRGRAIEGGAAATSQLRALGQKAPKKDMTQMIENSLKETLKDRPTKSEMGIINNLIDDLDLKRGNVPFSEIKEKITHSLSDNALFKDDKIKGKAEVFALNLRKKMRDYLRDNSPEVYTELMDETAQRFQKLEPVMSMMKGSPETQMERTKRTIGQIAKGKKGDLAKAIDPLEKELGKDLIEEARASALGEIMSGGRTAGSRNVLLGKTLGEDAGFGPLGGLLGAANDMVGRSALKKAIDIGDTLSTGSGLRPGKIGTLSQTDSIRNLLDRLGLSTQEE